MRNSKPVPDIVIGRLPIYLRALTHMLDEGQQITASKELAERLGISSAQIRKDLSHFGEFGKQGMGYDIAHLRDQIKRILKVDRIWDAALVGAGDLGHAIVQYGGFEGRGFRVACVFDNNPQKIGRRLGRFQICETDTLQDCRMFPAWQRSMQRNPGSSMKQGHSLQRSIHLLNNSLHSNEGPTHSYRYRGMREI